MQQVMIFLNDYFSGQDSLLFYIARASGITAYLMLFIATAAGIVISMKTEYKKLGPVISATHNYSSIIGIIFIVIHFSTLAISESNSNIFDFLLPFSGGKSIFLSFGIIGFYFFSAVLLSTFVKKKLSSKVWRALHISAYAGFVICLLHSIVIRPESNILPVVFI